MSWWRFKARTTLLTPLLCGGQKHGSATHLFVHLNMFSWVYECKNKSLAESIRVMDLPLHLCQRLSSSSERSFPVALRHHTVGSLQGCCCGSLVHGTPSISSSAASSSASDTSRTFSVPVEPGMRLLFSSRGGEEKENFVLDSLPLDVVIIS